MENQTYLKIFSSNLICSLFLMSSVLDVYTLWKIHSCLNILIRLFNYNKKFKREIMLFTTELTFKTFVTLHSIFFLVIIFVKRSESILLYRYAPNLMVFEAQTRIFVENVLSRTWLHARS